eukprot:TRINITY_DN1001_c0_g1_i13.p1 TRINITY_DN1001_c0_g1~~TRINITY_DN1001_c0_g1_i13.p1  ORF type:complete len:113 (-),score=29.34 TRINITY_DN1001_c0_g1_i13:79-417(-)
MEPEEFTNLELLRNYELRPSRSGQLPSLQAVYAQGISAQQLGELFAEGPPQPPPRSVDVAQLHFMHRSCTNLMKPSEAGCHTCLLYTSDAADEEDSVDLGGRRIIKKKKKQH